METFYKTFDEIKHKYYDGLIVTGAPVEQMPFEEVDYWQELTQVFDWSKKHVYSTLHLCWGAQAGLYYKHGVDKVPLSDKLSGIYRQTVDMPENFLMNGFDDSFVSPHSRYTEVRFEDIKNKTDLDIVVSGPEVGLSILASKNLREVYSFGHFEYDRDTLAREYRRDLDAGINPDVPANYFPEDDPSQEPKLRWNLAASAFFSNWINYAVYQETPYRLEELEDDFHSTVICSRQSQRTYVRAFDFLGCLATLKGKYEFFEQYRSGNLVLPNALFSTLRIFSHLRMTFWFGSFSIYKRQLRLEKWLLVKSRKQLGRRQLKLIKVLRH